MFHLCQENKIQRIYNCIANFQHHGKGLCDIWIQHVFYVLHALIHPSSQILPAGQEASASPLCGRKCSIAAEGTKVPATPPSPRNPLPYGHRKCHSLGFKSVCVLERKRKKKRKTQSLNLFFLAQFHQQDEHRRVQERHLPQRRLSTPAGRQRDGEPQSHTGAGGELHPVQRHLAW